MTWRTLALSAALCATAIYARIPSLDYVYDTPWGGSEAERVAVSLVRGDGWSEAFPGCGPTAHVAPAYPLMLAALYTTFGDYHPGPGRTAQQWFTLILATAAIAVLPFLAVRLGFPPLVAWAAAFVAAVRPGNVIDEVTGHQEQVPGTLALYAILWALVRARDGNWTASRGLVAGLAVGLAALVVPSVLLVPVLFFAVEVVRGGGRVFRCAVLAATTAGLVLAPWAVRNKIELGGFVPVRSNFGLELAVGNRPGANGWTYADGFNEVHPLPSPVERERLKRMGELPYMAARRREALDWIAANPGEFARLTAYRAALFACVHDSPGTPILRTEWDALFYLFVGVAAAVGVVRLLVVGHPAGVLLACSFVGAGLPYWVTHVDLRYHLPLLGLAILVACDLVWAAVRWVWKWV